LIISPFAIVAYEKTKAELKRRAELRRIERERQAEEKARIEAQKAEEKARAEERARQRAEYEATEKDQKGFIDMTNIEEVDKKTLKRWNKEGGSTLSITSQAYKNPMFAGEDDGEDLEDLDSQRKISGSSFERTENTENKQKKKDKKKKEENSSKENDKRTSKLAFIDVTSLPSPGENEDLDNEGKSSRSSSEKSEVEIKPKKNEKKKKNEKEHERRTSKLAFIDVTSLPPPSEEEEVGGKTYTMNRQAYSKTTDRRRRLSEDFGTLTKQESFENPLFAQTLRRN